MSLDENLPGAALKPGSRRKKDLPRPSPERLSYRVDTLAEALDISREMIYQAIRKGDLDARKWGDATLITAESAKRFMAGLPRYKVA